MKDIDAILEGLSPDEILQWADRIGSKVDDARTAGDVQAFLKIEKILEDRNMDTKEFKELVQLRNYVNELRSKKYTDGAGNFWSGRGKRPAWVNEKVGKDGDISSLKFENDNIIPLNQREENDSKN